METGGFTDPPVRAAFSTLAFPDATLASVVSLGRRWGYAGVEKTAEAALERYLTGLLTELPNKHCDTMAGAVPPYHIANATPPRSVTVGSPSPSQGLNNHRNARATSATSRGTR